MLFISSRLCSALRFSMSSTLSRVQTAMLDISQSMYEIVDLMTTILRAVSVFVAFTLGFLIIYASRFLIKRRGKEFEVSTLRLAWESAKSRACSSLRLSLSYFISLVVGLVVASFSPVHECARLLTSSKPILLISPLSFPPLPASRP